MKKIFLSLAIAAAAISCNSQEETYTPAVNEGRQISVNVLSSDAADAATRTVTTEDGDEWIVKWDKNDVLWSWTMTEDGATKDEALTKFTMSNINDGVDATFKGTAKNDKIRFVHYVNNSGYQKVDKTIQINYANQQLNMKNPLDALQYAVMVTEDLADVASLTDDAVTPVMQHVGAAVKLNLRVANLPTENTYKIKKVVVGSAKAEAGYAIPVQLVKIRPEEAMDSENFIAVKTVKAINLDATQIIKNNPNNVPVIAQNTTYSIYFNTFEFEVANAEKLQITVTLAATNADGASADVTKSFDIENNSGKTMVFERGKHHWLNKMCDFENPTIDFSGSTGGGTEGGQTGGDTEKPKPDTGGDQPSTEAGSEANPIKIATADDLKALATAVADGAAQIGVHYALQGDIDLAGSETNQWTPIGLSNAAAFKGVFDGQGHTISGLFINNEESYQGLFGYVASQGTTKAIIKNINVKGNVTGGLWASGVIGGATQAVILNCSFEGSVTGSKNQGAAGIVGQLQNSSEVRNCYNLGTINGTKNTMQVGGIMGLCQNTCFVDNCYNAGTINSSKNSTGAIYGQRSGKGDGIVTNIYSLADCVNLGTITPAATASNGTPYAVEYMQGQIFVNALNANVAAYDGTYKGQLKEWTLNAGGYPTFK